MHFLIQTKSWSSAWNRLSTVSKLNQVISQRVLSPCTHFVSKCFHISNPSVCTFNIHHIDLYFCGIKPTCMFWRVMEFYLVQNLFCFLFAECFVELLFFMDIEIIRNQSDDFSFRIVFGNENFHELCKILHCSPFGYPVSYTHLT